MIFVIGTTKPNAHELDKETLRLTHHHFNVRCKITKVDSPANSFFNIDCGVNHLERSQNFLEN